MVTITEQKGEINTWCETMGYSEKHASLCTIALSCFKTIQEDTQKHKLIEGDITEFMDNLMVEFLEQASEIGIISKRESK